MKLKNKKEDKNEWTDEYLTWKRQKVLEEWEMKEMRKEMRSERDIYRILMWIYYFGFLTMGILIAIISLIN